MPLKHTGKIFRYCVKHTMIIIEGIDLRPVVEFIIAVDKQNLTIGKPLMQV
jgi:hypothetical protein